METSQKFDLIAVPIRRPLATVMFFAALLLLGSIALQKMPISLFPKLEGDVLTVQFARAGSDPDFIEREILNRLESQVKSLPDIVDTVGEIRGSSGALRIEFEPDTDLKVREYELRRIAARLQRDQPLGSTYIQVQSFGSGGFDSFVMSVSVYGALDDTDALFDLTVERLAPRFAAIPGVAQANVSGGGGRQVTVTVEPSRAAGLGVSTTDITDSIARAVGQKRFLGDVENEAGRTDVYLDGRVQSLDTLNGIRVINTTPLELRHVSDLEFGYARQQNLFRVNGNPAVGLEIHQEQSANLLEVGRLARQRVTELNDEFKSMGLELSILGDGAEEVEKQIARLGKLGAVGLCFALIVLFMFLRQWRAVLVVGISVPVSIVLALSALYLLGFGINLLTLFGLAISVGLLVDNSVVVYEAILRSLERGTDPDQAVRNGLRRTLRAIVAASATTAVVFFPVALIDLENTFMEEFSKIVAAGLLLPLASSLLVAVGLVPLLAHRLAAPAAMQRVARLREQRQLRAGFVAPDRLRILLSSFSRMALRHPPSWLTGICGAVILTLFFALPWLIGASTDDSDSTADEVELSVRFSSGTTIDRASRQISRLEQGLAEIEGVAKVVSNVSRSEGRITVEFVDEELRPDDLTVGKIRSAASAESKKTRGMDVMRPGEGEFRARRGRGAGGRAFFSGGSTEVIISGPNSATLQRLGESMVEQLNNVQYVAAAWLSVEPGIPQIVVSPNRQVFEALGMTVSQIFPMLNLAGQDGYQSPRRFTLPSGRELGITIQREQSAVEENSLTDLRRVRVPSGTGANIPLENLAILNTEPPPAVIVHHNGRREMKLRYGLSREVPRSGPTREAITTQIEEIIRAMPRPEGYTVEQPEPNTNVSLMTKLAIPCLLFLFLILAITFESLSLPVLVLLAIPLAALGSLWGLVFTGKSLDPGVMVGIFALFGITVNPAILLVDRMQRRVLDAGWSTGAAAYAAIKERTRPILLTTATTIAALLPLSVTTGDQNEIWPGFATTVMGGLVTSALLSLLVIPVVYILLRKLDQLFGRVGPWLMVGWLAMSAALVTPLVIYELLESMFWIFVVSVLIGSTLLALIVLVFRRTDLPVPEAADGPPKLEVTHLRKVYGLPGPFATALNAQKQFVEQVVAAGGQVFSRFETYERMFIWAVFATLMAAAGAYVDAQGWKVVAFLSSSGFIVALIHEIRRHLGRVDAHGAMEGNAFVTVVSYGLPWLALSVYASVFIAMPVIANPEIALPSPFFAIVAALALFGAQLLRRNAVKQTTGTLDRNASGWMRIPRTMFRKWARTVGGLDLQSNEVHALSSIGFTATRGMIGILGPNGAGKTTLLRQLAGILDPTGGVVRIGGVPISRIRKHLARWIGYLPQDAGLPVGHTPREYLLYYAALYDIPMEIRHERVNSLLDEVGLAEKIDDKIGSLSGGMRQRVAVARTLLRLPPIIIVDEPTVGLDPRERIRFRNLLSRLAENRIVLFSTHVVEDVSVACERVLVLANSKMQFDGSPTELSKVADGKVWQTETSSDNLQELPQGAILAAETPTTEGRVRRRILANAKPSDDATGLNASPEDGYLWLIGPAPA